MGKPRGIRCARKLRVHRKEALWADKDNTRCFGCLCLRLKCAFLILQDYKKANLGTKYKCNPFGGTTRPFFTTRATHVLCWGGLIKFDTYNVRNFSCKGHCCREDWHWSKAAAWHTAKPSQTATLRVWGSTFLFVHYGCQPFPTFSPLWYGNFQFFWTFYLSFFNLLCKEQLLQVKINHDSHFIFRPNSAIRKCCRGELTSFFGSMAYSLAFICNLFSVSDLLRCSVDQEWQEDCSLCSKASQCDRFDILWPKLLFWKPLTRDGCLNFIDENDEVLISGFGRRGHAAAS